MEFERRKRPLRQLGRVIDVTNIILSVIVLTSAVFVAIDREKNILLFPVIFLCTGLINLALAIKYHKRNEMMRFIALVLACIIFIVFGILSILVVTGSR